VCYVYRANTGVLCVPSSYTIEFMNRYFAYEIKQVPVISGFKRRESLMVLGDPSTASAIPSAYAVERRVGASYYGGLPDKIAPTEDMVSVDTLSLPGASIIIYNNWPRVPTGTPAFITRYCQIEDPYTEGGQPMKVEVLECPAAEGRGFPCSCGFIHFVGWDWLGSNNNVSASIASCHVMSYLTLLLPFSLLVLIFACRVLGHARPSTCCWVCRDEICHRD